MNRNDAIRLLTGKSNGVEEWNRQRRAGEPVPDLPEVNLAEASLVGANLRGMCLARADLSHADLSDALLGEGGRRRGEGLVAADLSGAKLCNAILVNADLRKANLNDTSLKGARLVGAFFWGNKLVRTDFTNCVFGYTTFADLDLSAAVGLETATHEFLSTIGDNTFEKSKGRISDEFLRGCGSARKIDFKEIESGEKFEFFCRDFLEASGLTIQEGPSRGPDGGRDLIVVEDLRGVLTGLGRKKWLVSAKHYARKGKSVTLNDESNVIDRLRQFQCEGFVAFYSTLPSSGLDAHFRSIREKQGRDVLVFDQGRIEACLRKDSRLFRLVEQYFPGSAKKSVWSDEA